MDYVREEFLRQRDALSKLLLGRGKTAVERTLDSAGPASGSPAAESPGYGTAGQTDSAEAARERIALETSAPAAAENGWIGMRGEPNPLRGKKMEPERAETAFHGGEMAAPAEWNMFWKTAEEAPREERQSAGEMAPAEEFRRGGAADFRPGGAIRPGLTGTGGTAEKAGTPGTGYFEDGVVQERTVTAFYQAEGGNLLGPEALSRVFQRDARRYDGGFPLY